MKAKGWMRRAVAVLGVAALCALAPAALIADDDASTTAGAGGRAVRLSSVDGAVQVSQGTEVLADHALANTPLFEGMTITTGDDGRAEVQFEDGSVARIPPESAVTLSVLRPGESELTLENGMGYFELQDSTQNKMRVRFGSDVVTGRGFTVLRVRLDQGPGDLAVFSGNAHIDDSGGASMDVRGGESVSVGSFNLTESIEPDSWDSWNSDRDQAITTADVGTTPATDTLPNSANPAWGDLNSNGTWYDVPDQGYVWSPYEASSAGWDPYGVGYWMFTPGYGYIWVSGYRWGFMPYQCGAWNWYNSFGWGWAPGGCNPWWGGGMGGYGGWGFTVGTFPRWYRLPIRPGPPRSRNPRPLQGNGGQRAPLGLRPTAPVIAVNHHEEAPVGVLPPRAPGHPIQIGGVVAQPLRPTAPGPLRGPVMGYHHELPGSTSPLKGPPTVGANPRPNPAPTNTLRPGYQPAPGATGRPVYAPAPGSAGPGGSSGGSLPPGSVTVPRPNPSPVYRPAPPPSSRPSAPPTYHPAPAPRSAPAPAPRSAPSPAPRPSGGGGGSHPSASPHK
jgi:hypothetical protein